MRLEAKLSEAHEQNCVQVEELSLKLAELERCCSGKGRCLLTLLILLHMQHWQIRRVYTFLQPLIYGKGIPEHDITYDIIHVGIVLSLV